MYLGMLAVTPQIHYVLLYHNNTEVRQTWMQNKIRLELILTRKHCWF